MRAVKKTSVFGVLSLAALLSIFLPGCVSKKEAEKLKAENQHLGEENQQLQSQLLVTGTESADVKATLDDVQASLQDLRAKEMQVVKSSIEVVHEGKSRSTKREQLKEEIGVIRQAVKENLEKLAKLEKQKNEAEAKARSLGKKSAALTAQLSSLERLVTELRSSLEEKDAMISALEGSVLHLKETVESQATALKEKESVIETQTKTINKAFVAIATRTSLRKKGIIERKGAVLGLGGRWLQTGKFDPEVFREIDVTEESEFAISAPMKRARVLSDHPRDSYELTADGEKASRLKVTDTARFWQGARHLVVMLAD